MALHRDIYWVGRQWAVTGFGVQAVNQKQKGKFDIEAARLWEDGLLESLRAEPWLNIEDFDKALEVARKHFPEPPRKAPPAARAKGRGTEGARLEQDRHQGNSKAGVFRRDAEAGGAEIRHAHRRLAREIRAAMAYPHSRVTRDGWKIGRNLNCNDRELPAGSFTLCGLSFSN